jgi:hypothetical protein
MLGMQNAMSNATDLTLHPNPAIRFRLVQRMKARASSRKRAVDPLGQRILSVLKYRIPLYQAVLATALLVVILPVLHTMIVSKLSDTASSAGGRQSVHVASDSIAQASQLDAVDSLGMRRDSSGDSLVLR